MGKLYERVPAKSLGVKQASLVSLPAPVLDAHDLDTRSWAARDEAIDHPVVGMRDEQ